MNQDLLENNYFLVDDYMHPERAAWLFNYLKTSIAFYPDQYGQPDQQVPGAPCASNMWEMLEMLVDNAAPMKAFLGEPVFPTYVYSRLYKNGCELKPHVDRPACEISMTVHLGSDGTPWPFYIRKPNNEVVGLDLKPGQTVIYMGNRAEHWREPYQGQEYGQMFMHYVLAKGKNKIHYFDKQQEFK